MTEARASSEIVKNVYRILEKLEEVVSHETVMLKSNTPFDIEDSMHQKGLNFLELTRLMQSLKGMTVDPELFSRIAKLQKSLNDNREILENHISAVQEVSLIMTKVIQSAESDGTYDRSTKGTTGGHPRSGAAYCCD